MSTPRVTRCAASRARRLLTPAIGVVLVVALAAAGPAVAARPAHQAQRCANADAVPSAGNSAAVRRATLCLVNVERRARGARNLKANARLRTAAQSYAEQMVAKDFFAHVSPTGSTLLQRIRRAAYLSSARSWSLGENLAWGTGLLATPAATVRNWMQSPPHRRNVLDRRFREVGIGVAIGAPGTTERGATYTTEFGRRS
jgi:uncharacterized protein YkwD